MEKFKAVFFPAELLKVCNMQMYIMNLWVGYMTCSVSQIYLTLKRFFLKFPWGKLICETYFVLK